MVPNDRPRSYYGRPVVKEPVWTWEIPIYFFTGGMAGASATLAYVAQLSGNQTLAKRAWQLAFAGAGVSPVLLISDLGRPERFFNMLRVFKVTSPMSVGSWILAANGGLISLATLAAMRSRPGPVLRLASPAAAVAGPALSTYTAVLIANSAIPAWSEARRHLPFIFAAGSAASAGAGASLLTPASSAGPARRLAIGGALVELVAGQMMERSTGDAGKPYRAGDSGRVIKVAKGLTAAGAGLMAYGSRRRSAAVAGAGSCSRVLPASAGAFTGRALRRPRTPTTRCGRSGPGSALRLRPRSWRTGRRAARPFARPESRRRCPLRPARNDAGSRLQGSTESPRCRSVPAAGSVSRALGSSPRTTDPSATRARCVARSRLPGSCHRPPPGAHRECR